jgi:hypothetical protein
MKWDIAMAKAIESLTNRIAQFFYSGFTTNLEGI